MAAHATLSPSAADRWSTCTASVEATKDLTERPSVYAQEGTDAHDLLEKAIKSKTRPDDKDVALAYDYVSPLLDDDDSFVVLSETQVKLTEDCWGTADVITMSKNGEMQVIDYKHGKGVLVEPDCKQLLIYAAAALESLEWLSPTPITHITTVIIQPRAQHPDGPIRTWHRTRIEVLQEAGEIINIIDNIKAGRTEFCPTEKGCRFCKLKGSCRALADKAMEAVKAHFSPVGFIEVPDVNEARRLTVEEKGAILEARGLFKTFLAAVEADVEETLLAGGTVPGFKVVAGRSNRRFDKNLSDEEILNILTKELKLKVSDVAPPKLLGPAPIEKMLDTKKRNGKAKVERLQSIIVKPEGKPTIVPEADKRPALKQHFEEVVNPLS